MSIYAKEEIERVRAEYEAEIKSKDEMIAKLRRQLTLALDEVAKNRIIELQCNAKSLQ